MSKFIRNITVSQPFQGDTVVATFKPMSFVAALEFKALIAKLRAENSLPTTDDDGEEIEIPITDEFTNLIFRLTKDHLVSFAGLKTVDGADVTMGELFGAAFFVNLVKDLGQEWIQKSMPEKQAGNS